MDQPFNTTNNKYFNGAHNGNSEPVFDIRSPEFSSDSFRMFDFKVKQCPRTRAHDWTQCPFAHPGEKARRRDPRKFQYSAVPCPDYRKGTCKRGDSCEFAHGVFECWLHPTRYRTQMCTDGESCNRLVCFFAHRKDDLRQPSDMCVMAESQQPAQNKGVKDQLFSVALAHLLALQSQQQVMTSSGANPYASTSMNMQQNPQMSSLIQQAEDIRHQILNSQAAVQARMANQGRMPQFIPVQNQKASYEDQMHQNYMIPHVSMSPSSQKSPMPYFPLSPSSPIDAHFSPEESPVQSPVQSPHDAGLHQMASSMQELSIHRLMSENEGRQLAKSFDQSYHHDKVVDSAIQASVGKCGSLENLLQALPRTLSDVGLADAANGVLSPSAAVPEFHPRMVQS